MHLSIDRINVLNRKRSCLWRIIQEMVYSDRGFLGNFWVGGSRGFSGGGFSGIFGWGFLGIFCRGFLGAVCRRGFLYIPPLQTEELPLRCGEVRCLAFFFDPLCVSLVDRPDVFHRCIAQVVNPLGIVTLARRPRALRNPMLGGTASNRLPLILICLIKHLCLHLII